MRFKGLIIFLLSSFTLFSQDTDCNLLFNGNFETDISNWEAYGSTPVFNAGLMELGEIIVGTDPWNAAVGQFDISMTNGENYMLSFDASATSNRSIGIKVGLGIAPYTTYFYEVIDLTNQVQTYSLSFTMEEATTNIGALSFFVGTNAATIFLDNISLQLANCDNTTPVVDNDNDGFNSEVDCYDDNAAINPNAVEIPNNGIDENCDGIIDNNANNNTTICNFLVNPDFDITVFDWGNWGCTSNWNNGEMEVTNIISGANGNVAAVRQTELTIVNGASYSVSFDARAAANRNITFLIGLGQAPWTAFLVEEVSITTVMQTYNLTFTMNEPTTNIGSYAFFLGIDDSDVFLDNTEIRLSNCIEVDSDQDGFFTDVDCDDTNPAVYPGAPEILDNGIDEDCDGEDLISPPTYPSPFIHVDQFGYTNNAEKVAVISNPTEGYNAAFTYSVGNLLELRNFETDAVVFSAAPTIFNNGNTHDASGDQGWWFDFSSITEDGTYYVFDPSTEHRSPEFVINENPYQEVLKAAVKTFYHWRLNTPKEVPYTSPNWVDSDNFSQDIAVRDVYDQNNPATEKDMRGGWFDAGDYNKYVTFAHKPIHHLLGAYEDNPSLFTDDWNIPESGDGVPDILNEVRWELDWFRNMFNVDANGVADGSVHLKMGSIDGLPNQSAPASNNSNQRYYTPTCSSASITVASTYAHAATVFSSLPGMEDYAQNLIDDAILCWNYYLPFHISETWETNCDDLTVRSGDADMNEQDQIDRAVTAAVYLFEYTEDVTYSNFIVNNIDSIRMFKQRAVDPIIHLLLSEALLKYTNLPGADPVTITKITDFFFTQVNGLPQVYAFNEADLYRANIPNWAYHWGSNEMVSDFAMLSQLCSRYNILPAQNDNLARKANEALHYLHGVNPQGIVYLSNMYQYGAERSANQIFNFAYQDGSDWDHALNSLYGPPPGFFIPGPNQTYTGTMSPPANQPPQKSYLDFNIFDDRNPSQQITECGIYHQAAYIRFLATYVNNTITVVDNDNDGFNSDEDCDDNNAAINPNATEIANNNIDENCDGVALMIDNDNDGFNSYEDCDDNNAAINPNAIEIANNNVDEDCDGMDLIDNANSDCNLITNSEFETDIDDWNAYGCTPIFNGGTIEVGTIVVGANPWDAAVGQFDLTLTHGQAYTITFDARADVTRSIAVKAGLSIPPFTSYLYEEISLTPQMESYSFSFVMNEPSTTIASLDFFVGTSAVTVFLDNISLQAANCGDNTNGENMITSLSTSAVSNSTGKVFPNPSMGIINFKQELTTTTNKPTLVEVIDLWGRIVYTEKNNLTDLTTLDLVHLMEGIYFLKVNNNIHRFIITRAN